MYKATVIIKRRPNILDPQGKAVEQGAKLMGFNNVSSTRIGKYIEFFVNTDSKSEAENEVKLYSEKLLSNPIMEDFEYELDEVK
ncbi:MAG: phosphoribosylformylglycinamidine synthase subunit PurS [Melioribacteraceae bacterium]|nr:phosphoribosylformylglycinamidine synthase subunit PurS [Melioribacteraceae bacterium]MCF8265193.1 phosphoribosylformylglycinamidine synthase subunit PurS [Melioribacteraceae bacterium]MCF8413764.1 phosphoribosylformylglycinamidine synthase subunit PurS [Melioribacteraceae bacterium]